MLNEGAMKNTSLLLLLTLLGCASARTVKSWLDPVSSATITAQSTPLVVARDERGRSTEERDCAQLAAVEGNRMGERPRYLAAVWWSAQQHTRTEREAF